MGNLDSAAVVTIEPLSTDPKKKTPSTGRVLTLKKVRGENECYQSTEPIGGKSKLSIQKATASIQVSNNFFINPPH